MQAASQRNVRFVGHSDQGGRSDGVQVMVHRGHAYVGHIFSGGFTVVDVRDPKNPASRRLRADAGEHLGAALAGA